MPARPGMKQIASWLPEEEAAAVQAAAAREDRTVSSLVHAALREYLERRHLPTSIASDDD